jgi:hypothetical protein
MRALEKTLEETSGASLMTHAATEQIKQGLSRGEREKQKMIILVS